MTNTLRRLENREMCFGPDNVHIIVQLITQTKRECLMLYFEKLENVGYLVSKVKTAVRCSISKSENE